MGTLANQTGTTSRSGVWCYVHKTDAHASSECPKAQAFAAARKANRVKERLAMAQHETATVRVKAKPGPKPKAAATTSNGAGAPLAPAIPAVVLLQQQLAALEGTAGRIRKALSVLEA